MLNWPWGWGWNTWLSGDKYFWFFYNLEYMRLHLDISTMNQESLATSAVAIMGSGGLTPNTMLAFIGVVVQYLDHIVICDQV